MTTVMAGACAMTISFQAWYVLGAVYRFGKSGRFASGDDLEKVEEGVKREDWLIEVHELGYQPVTGAYIAMFHFPMLYCIFQCCCCC